MLRFTLPALLTLVQDPAPSGRIVFASTRAGPHTIFVMNADGSDVRQLARGMEPAWSPDGKKIAYTASYLDGGDDITVMNADGSNPVRLTKADSQDRDPAWSPDGTKIAFWSSRDDRDFEIYVIQADGTGERRVTQSKGNDMSPSWTPDGKRIVFQSYRDGNQDVYVMDADGSDPRRVTDGKGNYSDPVCSPDGNRIAYVQWVQGKGNSLVACAMDGSGAQILIADRPSIRCVSWSPDGKWLVFAGKIEKKPDEDIFTIGADGRNEAMITWQKGFDWDPNWGR